MYDFQKGYSDTLKTDLAARITELIRHVVRKAKLDFKQQTHTLTAV